MNVKDVLDFKNADYTSTGIDYTRFPRIWGEIQDKFSIPKIVHIIGTNGKGSTGRFLALMLSQSGQSVGHFTSPHILKLNERFWIDGDICSDDSLNDSHHLISRMLEEDILDQVSYFEYLFLLCLVLMKDCDYIVLEAGLGGEYDATSVVDSVLTLVSKIGLDHQGFLGNDISSIALTKLKSIKQKAIVGFQDEHQVYDIAKNLASQNDLDILYLKDECSDDTRNMVDGYIAFKSLPEFFSQNILLAIEAYRQLGFDDIDLNNISLDLEGRMQKISSHVTIDVGHNPLAASEIVKYFKNQKIHLIYNTYGDKDFKEILQILRPIVKKVLLLETSNPRMAKIDDISKILDSLGMDFGYFDKIQKSEQYLVFGSFVVVEEFLRRYFDEA